MRTPTIKMTMTHCLTTTVRCAIPSDVFHPHICIRQQFWLIKNEHLADILIKSSFFTHVSCEDEVKIKRPYI